MHQWKTESDSNIKKNASEQSSSCHCFYFLFFSFMFTVLADEIQFNNGLKEKLPPCQFPLVSTALLGALTAWINANVPFVLYRERSNLSSRQTGKKDGEGIWKSLIQPEPKECISVYTIHRRSQRQMRSKCQWECMFMLNVCIYVFLYRTWHKVMQSFFVND